jgi:hypothetical protein
MYQRGLNAQHSEVQGLSSYRDNTTGDLEYTDQTSFSNVTSLLGVSIFAFFWA